MFEEPDGGMSCSRFLDQVEQGGYMGDIETLIGKKITARQSASGGCEVDMRDAAEALSMLASRPRKHAQPVEVT